MIVVMKLVLQNIKKIQYQVNTIPNILMKVANANLTISVEILSKGNFILEFKLKLLIALYQKPINPRIHLLNRNRTQQNFSFLVQ